MLECAGIKLQNKNNISKSCFLVREITFNVKPSKA